MPQGVIIVGIQWGDEGKGKIVDCYSKTAEVVARFQGGNNAGHTVVVEGQQVILHLIPSGILHPHCKCVIGSGVVVDPEIFLEEVASLEKAEVPNLRERVLLDERCHLILNYHRELDAAREGRLSGKLGTTKRGIGPAYEDKATRRGLRIADLFNKEHFVARLRENLEEKNFLLKHLYKAEEIDVGKTVAAYQNIGEQLRPYVTDASALLYQFIQDGQKVLFEGAQGVLLDIDYGTYPFVTSSHTLPLQSSLGLGVRIPKDTLFMGILKAYTTRVGEGPFPTELKDAMGERLRESGAEFGATTGRPRRCGWLDLVAVKYALRVTGIKHLAITKSDILTGIEELKVCTGYEVNGKKLDTLPADTTILWNVKPVYQTLPGWEEDLQKITSKTHIPKNLGNYIQFIENYLDATVNLVSTGPGREHVININDAF